MEYNEENAVNEYICATQQILGDMTIYTGKAYISLGESLIKSGQTLKKKGKKKIEKGQARKEKYSVQSPRTSQPVYSPISRQEYSRPIQPSVQQPQKDDVLILFVKADGGDKLLREIANSQQLQSDLSEDLYLNVINIWMGTTADFNRLFANCFVLRESRGNSAPLDFVMIKIDLQFQYGGLRKGKSSIERMNAIGKLCDDNVRISQISNRLNFGVLAAKDHIWEK